MIPFCQDEISTRPEGTGFTLGLHEEINFHSGKWDKFPPGMCLQKPVHSH